MMIYDLTKSAVVFGNYVEPLTQDQKSFEQTFQTRYIKDSFNYFVRAHAVIARSLKTSLFRRVNRTAIAFKSAVL